MNNNTKSNNKSKAELKSRILSKNFLPRHLEPFTTSKSTTSLPDLLKNVASSTTNTSRLVIDSTVDLSTPMKRGNSYQMTPNNNTMEDLKRKAYAIIHNNTLQNTSFYSNEKDFTCSVRDRRHSFSSFLNVKYGKAAKSKAASEYKVKLVTSPHTQTHSVNKQIPSQISHRPRSYSEVSVKLPHVERAPPVAITNKTPAYEYYGFGLYLSSFVVFIIYIIWAYVPDEILHSLGISYYPNRYWALAIPTWIMTLVWFIFISFMAINLMNTAPFDSYDCITDEHANIMCMDRELVTTARSADWMPELHDIPIGLVNAFLYQDKVIPSPKTTPTHPSANTSNGPSPSRSRTKRK